MSGVTQRRPVAVGIIACRLGLGLLVPQPHVCDLLPIVADRRARSNSSANMAAAVYFARRLRLQAGAPRAGSPFRGQRLAEVLDSQ